MNVQILKKLSAVCLVLVMSAAVWACGSKGGSCGDKDRKDTTVITAASETELNTCGGKGGGCKGSDAGTKDK